METILPHRLSTLKQEVEEQLEKSRSLTDREISYLEKEGNLCSRWEDIRVAPHFTPDRVIGSTFRGSCYLGDFSGGDLDMGKGLLFPPGVYYSVISESHLARGTLVYRTGAVHRFLLAEGAAVFQADRLAGTGGEGAYLSLRRLPLGAETGTRSVCITPGITLEEISRAALNRQPPVQEEIQTASEGLWQSLAPPPGFTGILDTGCRVSAGAGITSAYAGPAARLDSAGPIRETLLLSTPENPVTVSNGAQLNRCILQPGSSADTLALAEESLLAEHSRIEEQAKVSQSYLGPNTAAGKGEISASLVGPFVGFHHQSLLIGALWPEGTGNVASGALVGSNHTGRLPDQELRGSAGLFFGLGCSISYPADFSRAPHTLIAAGTKTFPQRVAFPFSLISPPSASLPGAPPSLPEIRPGWVLRNNYYQILRTAAKIPRRSRSVYHRFSPQIFTPEVLRLLASGLALLESPGESSRIEEIYTEEAIPGLGRTILTERSRLQAVQTYRETLQYALLSAETGTGLGRAQELIGAGQLSLGEEERADLERAAGIDQWSPEERKTQGKRLADLYRERGLESRRKDDRRGTLIWGEDYRLTHPPAEEDSLLLSD